MRISVSDAKNQLDDLVRRAVAGDEVVLTHGDGDVRLIASVVDSGPEMSKEVRLRLIRELQRRVAAKGPPDASAARSQDFLYDEYGLPK